MEISLLRFKDSSKTDPEKSLKTIPNLMMRPKLNKNPKEVSKAAHGNLLKIEIRLQLLLLLPPTTQLIMLLMIRILNNKVSAQM
jgi:hypothetical protein